MDLKDLPSGSRLIIRSLCGDLDDEEVSRMEARIFQAWQERKRVFVLPGFDLFIITPDGKITGTAAAPQEEAAFK